MDFLIVRNLLVSMEKNKSWHSNLILTVIIQKYQKQGEISSEFIRSNLLPMAIFNTKRKPHMAQNFIAFQLQRKITFVMFSSMPGDEN